MKPLIFCTLDKVSSDLKDYPSCNIIDKDTTFFSDKKIKDIINHVKENNSNLHITGLLSDNSDYSNIDNLLNLIDIISESNINNVYFYIFLDGKVIEDSINNLKILVKKMKEKNIGTLSLIAGKKYMFTKNSYNDLIDTYDAICYKIGKKHKNLKEYFKDNYENKQVSSFNIGIINETKIEDNDAIISFNHNKNNEIEIIDVLANPNNYMDKMENLRHFKNLKILSFKSLSNGLNKIKIYTGKDVVSIFDDPSMEKLKVSNEDLIKKIKENNKYELIITDLNDIKDLSNYTVIIYSKSDKKVIINNKNIKLKDGNIKDLYNTVLELLNKKHESSLILKKKNKMGKKSKIFSIISILLMISLFITYLVRFIHYYKVEHPKVTNDNTLVSKVMNVKLVNNNGLVAKENDYIFKGKVKNNYVLYSGYLFRIVKVNEDRTIKLVTDDIVSSLVWSYETDYNNSYVKKYLEEIFLNNLNNRDKYLTNSKWCIDSVKNSEYKCKNKIDSQVGLLTLNDYMVAGSNNSYLNINKYWWTLNTSKDNKVWYIFDEGGINDDSLTNSYGIRPSIILNSNVEYVSGDGTIENPYIIENDKEINVGKYINYSGYKWKVIENKDNLKLVLAECLKENDECITHNFGKTNLYGNTYGSLGHYLNNVFYYTLDTSHLVKGIWYIGDYNEETSYDYNNIFSNNIESNVGILNIIENNIDNTYTLTRSDDELIYTLGSGKLYSSDPTEELSIYPAIYIDKNINIVSGSGTFNDPYEIGDKNEE